MRSYWRARTKARWPRRSSRAGPISSSSLPPAARRTTKDFSSHGSRRAKCEPKRPHCLVRLARGHLCSRSASAGSSVRWYCFLSWWAGVRRPASDYPGVLRRWSHPTPTPKQKVANVKNKLMAEFFGTFWLVFGGCGSAVLAAKFFFIEGTTSFNLGIGLVGVALAFGLTVLTMAFAIGHISGCHLNPAVSVGLCVGGRFSQLELVPYIVAQLIGAAAGSATLWVIASGQAGFSTADGFAANGFAEHSPGHYSLLACFVAETVLTFFFLMIILGATDKRAPQGFAPIAIGLGLTLIHLVGIPVTNTDR